MRLNVVVTMMTLSFANVTRAGASDPAVELFPSTARAPTRMAAAPCAETPRVEEVPRKHTRGPTLMIVGAAVATLGAAAYFGADSNSDAMAADISRGMAPILWGSSVLMGGLGTYFWASGE